MKKITFCCIVLIACLHVNAQYNAFSINSVNSYCVPSYSQGTYWDTSLITNVTLQGTSLSNNTGTGGGSYTYYTGQPNYTASLDAGSTYTLTVSVGQFGSQNIGLWIDYNDNFIFEGSEYYGSIMVGSSYGSVSFNIALSCSTPVGTHRMRIRDASGSPASDPCGNYFSGQTEDYDITILAAQCAKTWIGTTSSSWSTASNWSTNSVPTLLDNIVIPTNGSNAPVMDVDVTVPAGKSFTISGTGTLTIAPGKVLTIAGLADFGDKTVTFKSDATGTAMFGPLTGTLTGATNVKVERFIPLGKRAFRLLSPAVTTTTFISGNWQQGTHITGSTTGANGFDTTETGNPSMYTYNNQAASGTGWTPIANTNATNLTAGVGYRVLVRGDRNVNITVASLDNMNAATTLTATGTLKTGTVTLNSSSTPAINNQTNATTADYSLVGNPYQSAVDWHLVTKTGIDDTYYAWDPNMGTSTQRGRYVAYNGTTNDNASSQVGQYIQPGQAFFVKNTTSGTAGTLTFEESDKATTSASVFRMSNQTPSSADASMSMQLFDPSELAIGGYPIDGMKAVFNAAYQNALGTGDATKLESAGENIAWSRNNAKLAIDAAAPLTSTDELLVKTLRLGANKNYTFKIQTSNFDTTLTPYLVDNFLNTQTEITTSQAFLASFVTTTNAASYNEDRFKIVFTPSALHNDTFTNQIGLYPNPSKGNGFNLQLPSTAEASVKLFNTLGQEIGLTTNGSYYQATQSLPTGVYYIMVTQGMQTSKLKWIVE